MRQLQSICAELAAESKPEVILYIVKNDAVIVEQIQPTFDIIDTLKRCPIIDTMIENKYQNWLKEL